MSEKNHAITSILGKLEDSSREKQHVTLGDMLELFNKRVYGPFFLLFGVILLTPIGAVPGIPAVISLLIIILAVQLILGVSHPWTPKPLRKRQISSDRVLKAVSTIKPWAEQIEKYIHPRMTTLLNQYMIRLMAFFVILLAMIMIPLEIIPLAVGIPAAAIAAIGLAITARDGALLLAGMFLFVSATALSFWVMS